MTTTRALCPALFSLALAFSLPLGCGSIDVTKPDGAAGSSGGGTTGAGGAAGTGAAGTTGGAGVTGAAGSGAGRGGNDGAGNGGAGNGGGGRPGGAGGSSGGNAGAGGATGAAGRGGAAGTGAAGRGGAGGAAGSTAGRGGAAGSSAGRGGTGGTAGAGAGGRGGGAGTGAAGRGGAGGGPCNCQTIYMPVCGVDGMTYANSCEAMCVGVAIAYQGMCVKECQANADCIHYPEYVGTCCGDCLPTTAPKPPMISCAKMCDSPITCPCVAGKCTATPVGAASQ